MKSVFKKLLSCLLAVILASGFFSFISSTALSNISAKAADSYASTIKSGGIYYIKNQHSGLYLDVYNKSQSSGTSLLQYNYHGYFNQQFKITQLSDTNGIYYTITPMHCAYASVSRSVEVAGNSTANEAAVQLGVSGSGQNQKFKILSTGNGDNSFVIKTGSTSYSKCITVFQASKNSGTKIIQYSYVNGGNDDNDHWYFEEVPSFDGIYNIKNQNSGQYLDVDDVKTAEGTRLGQYTFHGSTNQQFRVSQKSDGYYTLSPINSEVAQADTVVEVKDGAVSDGTPIQLGKSNNLTKQKFTIVPTGKGDGSLKIVSALQENKCLVVLEAATNPGARIILYEYTFGTVHNDQWFFEPVSPLNEKKLITLSSSFQTVLDFTCPDDRLYTVETFPYASTSSDPFISVTGLSIGNLQDDDSGKDLQAKISFRGEKGKNLQVSARAVGTTGSRCYIQIRKQKAAMFGGNYTGENVDHINTNQDLNSPHEDLKDLYDSYRFFDAPSTLFTAPDERGFTNYNSEIMFFTGHGDVSSFSFCKGNDLYGYYLSDMNNVKIALWSSCHSAQTNLAGESLVTYSIKNGAKSALGFNRSILASDAKKFSNKFFETLANGKTVSEAAAAAKAQFIVWEWIATIKDFVIGGDGNTVITTPSAKAANLNDISAIYSPSLLSRFLSACEYETEAFEDGSLRYYKTIEGHRSNQYIDVKNGVVTSTNYSAANDDKPVLPILIDTQAASTENETINLLNVLRTDSVQIDTGIFYYFDGFSYRPIEINCITYPDKDRYQEMICIDLNTGNEVSYESIAYLEVD